MRSLAERRFRCQSTKFSPRGFLLPLMKICSLTALAWEFREAAAKSWPR
jgi:hypothetical protein